jgi:aldehyde:ferredoxin oxidoreductase
MEKLSNVREGWTRDDDEIPPQWIRNIEEPLKLRTGNSYLKDWFGRRVKKGAIEELMIDYYDEHGWDQRTGLPTKEKMIELGLKEYMGIVEEFLE